MAAWDFMVIGGGPAGLGAARVASGNQLKVLVIERSEPGGQLRWADAPIVDYVGFDGGSGAELAERMVESARAAGAAIRLGTTATAVARDPAGLVVRLHTGEALTCRRLLLATGCVPRRLGVPGEEGLAPGLGLRRAELSGRRVGIVGGGDEAHSLAADLAERGVEVWLIVRGPARARPLFRAPVERWVAAGKITRIAGRVVEVADAGRRLLLEDGRAIEVDLAVARVGVEPTIPDIDPPLARLGDGRIQVDASLRTSVEEIFAAGDLVRPPPERYLAVAISDGVRVARVVESDLRGS